MHNYVDFLAIIREIRKPVHIVDSESGRDVVLGEAMQPNRLPNVRDVYGTLPPIYPEWLGDRSFCETHGVRFPYIAGEMAHGISSTFMVVEMANAEMMSFFGAGGLAPAQVEQAVDTLVANLSRRRNWGVNLLH